MKKKISSSVIATAILLLSGIPGWTQTNSISNPVLWVDVPDPSVVVVDGKYYMSSTTMHMAPGVPIMESSDMVNWKTVSYAYNTLANTDDFNLVNGKNIYGKGSWASSIRYKNGTFYVLVPSYSTGKTYLFSTQNIHATPWTLLATYGSLYHDPSLLLDDDGHNYVTYGSGDIKIIELSSDLKTVKTGGINKTLIAGATAASGSTSGLAAEGSHIEKINGYYYVFLICWPSGSVRTELVFRSSTLTGTYTGKIGLQNQGVAQGSIYKTTDGSWWATLFQDNGSVGRSPWLIPVTWSSDWPVFGSNSTAPTSVTLTATQPVDGFGIVSSDDFTSSALSLDWQWNHNPDNANWSLSSRAGYLRIKNARVDTAVTSTRNTLTQRTFGPKCSGVVALDATGMADGDIAGLSAFQYGYGYVGVKVNGSAKSIVMVNASSGSQTQVASVAITQNVVYLRVDMDFTNRTDKATFYYSLNGTTWTAIGNSLQMSYSLNHFMGYRFGLFNFGTKSSGGYADFDWFKIGKAYNNTIAFSSVAVSSSAVSSSAISSSAVLVSSSSSPVGIKYADSQRSNGESLTYKVYDLQGKFVCSMTLLAGHDVASSVRNLVSQKGIYLVRSETGMGTTQQVEVH